MKVLPNLARATTLLLMMSASAFAQSHGLTTSSYNHSMPQEGERHAIPYFDRASAAGHDYLSVSQTGSRAVRQSVISHACPNQCR